MAGVGHSGKVRPKMTGTPLPAAQVVLVERGTVPCRVCGKPHDAYHRFGSSRWGSWESLEDGHAYYRMSAAEVVALYEGRK